MDNLLLEIRPSQTEKVKDKMFNIFHFEGEQPSYVALTFKPKLTASLIDALIPGACEITWIS